RIVAAKQGNFLGCSFHPELTDDHLVTELFVKMAEKHKQETAV
ncbi:pyridoxal 5'-phosphate synthase glutaminase subunit PdxT, partial [Citrobacter braakii]|nr:pyridoxal 5'-phosphate synthase glutaminase subunit PdxT [Citrobacter braakii]